MSRRLIIGGNWKMYKTPSEAVATAKSLKVKLINIENVDVVVCPTSIGVLAVREIVTGTNIKIGGQNMYHQDEGAFTGEISADMLKDAGCEYVVVGHSERRHVFGETDGEINKKVAKALVKGLIPIFCVGEKLEERNDGKTEEVVGRQLKAGLAGVEINTAEKLVIAYEPVWAIGTGVTASPEQAEEVHLFIRNLLIDMYGNDFAQQVRIQYGGSVKPANAGELLGQPNIDGALVGGASLEPDSFTAIIKSAQSAK